MNRSAEGSGVAVLRRLKAVPFAALLLFAVVAQAQAQSVRTHHVRREVANGQARFLNRMPGTQTMQIDIVLPLRDSAGLDSFLQDLYDPTSPSYRHFLTPQQFTEKFGPTQQDYDAAVGFAKSYGLRVVGGSRDGMDIQLAGSVTSVEEAFNISMGVYQHPSENRSFYAPDREPTVGLPFPIWHISGLDNFAIPHSALIHKSQAQNVKSAATTGSGPSASYLGSDMRAAYYGGPLTGGGQYVGLLEYYGYDTADLTTYFTNAHQTNDVPIIGVSTDGTSLNCVYSSRCDDTEQILDITQAVSMAPGLSGLYVFVGSTDTAILSSMSTKTPLAAQIGSSWAWTPGDPLTDDPYFKKFAAQGQNFFQASGDSGHYTSSTTYVFPADDAYVTTVGGTDLNTAAAGGAWASETAWVDGGGGYYTKDAIGIPSWQVPAITSANLGSKTYRNAPDVAANANFTYYVCADQTTCTANTYGGTSFAAPLWAGYMALVNQQALANGNSVLGFINPLIYSIGLSSGYSASFHDVTSGSNGYTAITGYDLATGWGSMNGAGLLNALAGTASAPNFTLSATPITVVQGSSGSSTVSATISGGFNAAIGLSASGQPSSVTVGFNPTSIAAPGSGSSSVTLTVASNTATGTYPISITGIGGGIMHTATLSLTVAGPANFTISASPNTLSVARGSRGTSTITTAISGSFSSAIGLSASGQPSGVTVSFSRTTIAAPGSGTSTLTLTVGTSAAAGTYPITITGTGGGITHSTTVNLTVTVPASFAVSVSPNSLTVTRGGSGSSTVTTTIAGSFNAAVALSASSLPSGVTVSFSPGSIAAPGAGTSKVTITVSTSARSTTRSITIRATSGGTTHTTSVSLTIN